MTTDTPQTAQESDKTISTIADVLKYLKSNGWKETKSSLYRHQKEGKLLPRPNGGYLQKDIDKYARTWLKQTSTGKKIQEQMDELQRKKLEKELYKLELECKQREFTLEKDQERYVPKEQMELELAARAGILDAGLRHWIQSHVSDWTRLVEGNMKKVGELINLMNHSLDEHMNNYASTREYRVIFDADHGEEPEEDNEI